MSDLRYLELHGDRVAYRDEGSGDVLLLIHGMAGSSETWRAVMPQLSKRYRVIAPDLLGHGLSAKPRSDYSFGAFAVLLRDLLDELGMARATIVGHSLGGGVAMQFVYQHPDYCERFILISSGGLGTDVGWIFRLLSAPGRVDTAGHRAMARFERGQQDAEVVLVGRYPITAGCGVVERLFLARRFRHASRVPAHAALGGDYQGQAVSALNRLHTAADLPTMAIWGDRDTIIPVDHAYAAHDARPTPASRCWPVWDISHTLKGPATWPI